MLAAAEGRHPPVFADKLGPGEIETPPVESRNAAGAAHAARQHLGAPYHRTYARHELSRIEWLGQIVVGAHLKPDDAVDVVAASGQEDNRRRTSVAQAPAYAQP